jgi:hypothetical protein
MTPSAATPQSELTLGGLSLYSIHCHTREHNDEISGFDQPCFAGHVLASSVSISLSGIVPSIEATLRGLPITKQILETLVENLEVQLARNSYVYRQGTELRLNGMHWTASGANVYWLGLDKNVQPPPCQPFYAPVNASYPTFERITEVMNTLVTMGARTIRSQTLGVSVLNLGSTIKRHSKR